MAEIVSLSLIHRRRDDSVRAILHHVWNCPVCHPDNPAGQRCAEGRQLMVWLLRLEDAERALGRAL